MTRSLKLAVGQSPSELEGITARVDWLASHLPDVAARGADILLLPELFASGYYIGNKVSERAETATGPTARAIAAMAKKYGVAIHYGFPELDGDNLYNSAQCFGPDGQRLGGHRKCVIPPGFEGDHFQPGTGFIPFAFKGVTFGTLICYDAEFAEAARAVALLGAEVILVPTALGAKWEWVARTMIPTRAFENGVFLAYANSAGVENGMKYLGQSFIAAPDGVELARAGSAPEIIHAQLDLDRVSSAQARLPYLKDRRAFDQ